MTFPSSGPLSFSDFNIKAGRAFNTNIDMVWIYDNTKSGQQSYSVNNYYNKNWYQRNVDGNCNNGNCANCNCNCGSLNCVDCSSFQCVNCANCDTRSWFQNNCNCACAYNCNQCNQFSYDCDCACCFPADAWIRMADGTYKQIKQIQVGDKVDGGYGYTNTVIAYHKIELGRQPVFTINGRHRTTREHRHFTTQGWAAIDIHAAAPEYEHEITIDNNGTTEKRKNIKLKDSQVVELTVGMCLITNHGPEIIESITVDYNQDPKQMVYTLVCDGTHAHVVNGFVVSAWARDDDFDYRTWTPK